MWCIKMPQNDKPTEHPNTLLKLLKHYRVGKGYTLCPITLTPGNSLGMFANISYGPHINVYLYWPVPYVMLFYLVHLISPDVNSAYIHHFPQKMLFPKVHDYCKQAQAIILGLNICIIAKWSSLGDQHLFQTYLCYCLCCWIFNTLTYQSPSIT